MSKFIANAGLLVAGQVVSAGDEFEAELDQVRDLIRSQLVDVSFDARQVGLIEASDHVEAGGSMLPARSRPGHARWTEAWEHRRQR